MIILDVRRLLRMLLPLLYAPFLVAARWVRRFCKWRFCMWAICKWAFCKWAFCKTLRKVRPGHVHSGLVRGFAPPVHVAMRIALPGLLSTAMARQHLDLFAIWFAGGGVTQIFRMPRSRKQRFRTLKYEG